MHARAFTNMLHHHENNRILEHRNNLSSWTPKASQLPLSTALIHEYQLLWAIIAHLLPISSQFWPLIYHHKPLAVPLSTILNHHYNCYVPRCFWTPTLANLGHPTCIPSPTIKVILALCVSLWDQSVWCKISSAFFMDSRNLKSVVWSSPCGDEGVPWTNESSQQLRNGWTYIGWQAIRGHIVDGQSNLLLLSNILEMVDYSWLSSYYAIYLSNITRSFSQWKWVQVINEGDGEFFTMSLASNSHCSRRNCFICFPSNMTMIVSLRQQTVNCFSSLKLFVILNYA